MNYIIYTPSARKLKDEILARVSAKVDGNGIGITTWQCVETDSGDKVLVLTEGQWARLPEVINCKCVSFIGKLVTSERMATTSSCLVDSQNSFWFIFPILQIK